MRIVVCHICKRSIKLRNESELHEDSVACQIKPRGEHTRYYCLSCWRKELEISKGVKHG